MYDDKDRDLGAIGFEIVQMTPVTPPTPDSPVCNSTSTEEKK